MFIGGLSWQTTPGKNFLLGLFQTFFKELKLFNIPFDKKKATNDIGMDTNELKSKFSILTMLDYQSGKTQSLPFLNVRNIY